MLLFVSSTFRYSPVSTSFRKLIACGSRHRCTHTALIDCCVVSTCDTHSQLLRIWLKPFRSWRFISTEGDCFVSFFALFIFFSSTLSESKQFKRLGLVFRSSGQLSSKLPTRRDLDSPISKCSSSAKVVLFFCKEGNLTVWVILLFLHGNLVWAVTYGKCSEIQLWLRSNPIMFSFYHQFQSFF